MNSEAQTTSYFLSQSCTGKIICELYKNDVASWPQYFHTSLSIIMGSPLPMFLLWGTDKLLFYNDAFSGIASFQGKHPHATGKDIRKSWPLLWEKISGITSRQQHISPVLLPVFNSSGIEDTYWTISISPVTVGEELLLGILQKDTSRNSGEKRIEDAEKKLRNVVHQSPFPMTIWRGPD